jgi:uncharacterized membrane protein YfcA
MHYLFVSFIGLFGGIAGGLFGIGGGTLYVPLLMIACGVDIHAAIGTSFAIMLPVTIVAGTKNAMAGMIAWKYVPLIVLFAVVGAWFGAKISIGMDDVLSWCIWKCVLLGLK